MSRANQRRIIISRLVKEAAVSAVTTVSRRRQSPPGYQATLGAPDTSVEFQRVNSRICVAMMVFAPIYVAQMISSYLRDPENKTEAFGWVKS